MLIGEYSPTMDAKGRMNFPAKLREDLGSNMVLTKGLDGCLFVFSTDEWQKLTEKISAMPISQSAQTRRFFFGSASLAEPDAQGRIMIPQALRNYAGLTKEITVIGASNRAEIWDSERWRRNCEELTDEMVAEQMDKLGI